MRGSSALRAGLLPGLIPAVLALATAGRAAPVTSFEPEPGPVKINLVPYVEVVDSTYRKEWTGGFTTAWAGTTQVGDETAHVVEQAGGIKVYVKDGFLYGMDWGGALSGHGLSGVLTFAVPVGAPDWVREGVPFEQTVVVEAARTDSGEPPVKGALRLVSVFTFAAPVTVPAGDFTEIIREEDAFGLEIPLPAGGPARLQFMAVHLLAPEIGAVHQSGTSGTLELVRAVIEGRAYPSEESGSR
jgi:hypothetical protein